MFRRAFSKRVAQQQFAPTAGFARHFANRRVWWTALGACVVVGGAAAVLAQPQQPAFCKAPDTPDYLLPYYLRDSRSRFNHYASIREDGNRYMTPKDFVCALLALKSTDDVRDDVAANLAALFEAVDSNSDGRISFREYSYMTILLVTRMKDFKSAFRMYDTENKGGLTRTQYKKMIISFGEDSMRPRFSGGLTRAMFTTGSLKNVPPAPKEDKDESTADRKSRRAKDLITFEKFASVVRELEFEVRAAEFRHADVENKGHLTYQEFGRILTDGGIQGRHLPFFIVENLRILGESKTGPNDIVDLDLWQKYNLMMKRSDEIGEAIQLYTVSGLPLTKPDFARAAQCAGMKLEEDEVQLLFDIFDKDRDGTLEYDEFMAVVSNKARFNVVSRSKERKNFFLQAAECTQKAFDLELLK